MNAHVETKIYIDFAVLGSDLASSAQLQHQNAHGKNKNLTELCGQNSTKNEIGKNKIYIVLQHTAQLMSGEVSWLSFLHFRP